VYKIKNVAQGTRREQHGVNAWRPHGVALASADGLVAVTARGTQMREFDEKRDLLSAKEPAFGLSKDGFFSARDRWYKSFNAVELADSSKAECLGPLPEPQLGKYCDWLGTL